MPNALFTLIRKLTVTPLGRKIGDEIAVPHGNPREYIRADGTVGEPLRLCVPVLADGAAVAWNNMPVVSTELFGATRHRTKVPLAPVTKARLVANVVVAGFLGAKLVAQYSTDQVVWLPLDGLLEPSVPINSTGLVVSVWVDLAALAQADVFLRVVGVLGNGSADPQFGNISIQFR